MQHLGISLLVLSCSSLCLAQEGPTYTRQEDVIYGRKFGMALTMDVFTPRQPNGAAVIYAVSGGWFSSHEGIAPPLLEPYLKRGYTVFAVVHGSQPRFTMPEAVADMRRAVRFIRYNAKQYRIDRDRIGMTGASAGAHLSLMMGLAGDNGDPNAKDPVDREPCRVAVVGCFFPPTDLLNFGEPGRDFFQALDTTLVSVKPALDFVQCDPKTNRYSPVTDGQRRMEIIREYSPITHVNKGDAPTLIIHGDADTLVPVQQAHLIEKALRDAGVPVQIVIKPGLGHGWGEWGPDAERIADWFDKYLKPAQSQPS
jgi:acetyl esterase/lipase